MRTRLVTLLTVIGAVTVLVLAGNTVALAATGHGFLLGKSNTATKETALSRTTAGTALKVTTKSSTSAPLAVNGKGKVTNLNADAVDGKSANAFDNAPVASGIITGSTDPKVNDGVGISAVTWDSTDNRYLITLTGRAYFYTNYFPVIAPACADKPYMTSSIDDKLIVQFGPVNGGIPCPNGFALEVFTAR
jgi:hypothetical protein